jgi:hypothetical protein
MMVNGINGLLELGKREVKREEVGKVMKKSRLEAVGVRYHILVGRGSRLG